jgi:predicted Zn finger-like uncharacterized protein
MQTLYTRCTHCETVFELTLEELNAAHGAVRCGVCRQTFNARDELREQPFAIEDALAQADQDRAGDDEPERSPTPDVSAPSGTTDSTPAEHTPADAEDPLQALDLDEEIPEELIAAVIRAGAQQEQADAEAAGLDDEPAGDDAFGSGVVVIDATPGKAGETPPIDGPPPPAETDATPDGTVASPEAADDHHARQTVPIDDDELASLLRPPARRRSLPATLALGAASVVLIVLLALQATVHWRNELVQLPGVGEVLLELNRRVGAPLTIDYDPTRYAFATRPRLVLLEPVTDGDDDSDPGAADTGTALQVVGSVRNTAAVPQPYPLLHLVIEDRWGRPIAARELTPEDYLSPTHSEATMLAAGASFALDVQVRSSSTAPESFAMDICLRRGDGTLHCAGR